jgi:ankyrin repeat protein
LLSRPSQLGYVEIVKLLLENGADVNRADHLGRISIHDAAETSIGTMRELLKQPNVDINKADSDGITALYLACKYPPPRVEGALRDAPRSTEIVKELLKYPGIDINKANNKGETPLYWAAANGHTEVVNELLKYEKLDALFKSKKGETAAQVAETPEIRELIEEHINTKAELARALKASSNVGASSSSSVSTAIPPASPAAQVDTSAVKSQRTRVGDSQEPNSSKER